MKVLVLVLMTVVAWDQDRTRSANNGFCRRGSDKYTRCRIGTHKVVSEVVVVGVIMRNNNLDRWGGV